MMGLGIWKGPDFIRGLQHNRFLAQAEASVAGGDYRKAMFSLRKALLKRPESIPALRLAADVAERAGSPEAVLWWARLVELEPDNPQHKLEWAEAALRFGDMGAAGNALNTLGDSVVNNADFHKLSAMLAVAMRDPKEAEEHFRQAIKLEPESTSPQFNLAVLQLASTNEAVADEARVTLTRLANRPEVRVEALRHLATDAARQRHYDKAREYTSAIIAEPEVAARDHMLHLSVLSLTATNEVEAFLATAQAGAADSAMEVFEVGTWMLRNGRAQGALDWISSLAEPLRQSQPLPTLLVELYAALGNIKGMIGYLEGQQWGDVDYTRLALLARGYLAQQERTAHDAAWRRALHSASKDARSLSKLAQLARQWNWGTAYEQCLEELVRQSPGNSAIVQELTEVYYAQGKTEALSRLLPRALDRDPTNALVKNNLAMTYLLLGENVPTAHRLAEEAHAQDGANPHFTSTYAYSLLCQDRTEEALKLFESLAPDYYSQNPGAAVYYGLALARAGRIQDAARYLEIASQGRLLPEETNLVAQARAQL
jgi:tetratricopeptide (TPR) repeat protein